ncbi:MAG TPA: site-specific DNA-methyltransferase [Bacteroidia bacterium]|nr:site-specific DNA-methyltransferase [Bacteroidia bacterium]
MKITKKTDSGIYLPYDGILIPTATTSNLTCLPLDTVFNADFRTMDLSTWNDCFFISDPPYNQNYHYDYYDDNLKNDEYVQLLHDAFWGKKSAIIHYPEPTINLLPQALMTSCTESAFWCYNSNTKKQSRQITFWNHRPDFKRASQPYKNPNDKRIIARMEAGHMAPLYDWWIENIVKNVSKIKSGNPHPCPIPEEIARKIILISTNPGDVVVDPFAGSGTICKVAKELGRFYIGFEIDPVYFQYMKSIGL